MKYQSRIDHAFTRFRQRYGRKLKEPQYRALCELAKNKKVFSLIGKNSVERVKFRIGDEEIWALYNRKLNIIETFLTKY